MQRVTKDNRSIFAKPAVLYRCYDADGRLLYIGITVGAAQRWKRHGEESGWWTEVSTIKLEHYAKRIDALRAEQAAIAAELPLFNQQDYPGRHPNSAQAKAAAHRSVSPVEQQERAQ